MKFREASQSFAEVLRQAQAGLRFFMIGIGITALAVSSGCGLNGGGEGETGEVIIGLTDAPGDFATYTVDVLSLTLVKANGTVVETLPLETRVDFTRITDMTEFLTAATVPSGVYKKATLELDYSNAVIQVEDEFGETVDAGAVVDGDGNPIGTLDVSVHLEGRNALLIAPGIPAHLTLDFDLNASNQVSFDADGNATVTVEPFLLADVNRESIKIHRVRGPLQSVSVEDNSFRVIIRPFYHRLRDCRERPSDCHRRFGTLKVTVGEETVYDIDGESYQGGEGLLALDTKPAFTAVVVLGNLKFHPVRFEAREVRAGSSVPGGDQDVVIGNVTNRVDDADANTSTLTVRGATLIRDDGSVVFRDSVAVIIGAETVVRRQLSADKGYGIDDISIGQRVRIFGVLTSEIPGALEMDALSGHVGMGITALRGQVTATANVQPQLTIDLQSIDTRPAGIFELGNAGADASIYRIDSGELNVSDLDASPVKVLGFVKPWQHTEAADFDAQTVIDVSNVRAAMAVSWVDATATPFLDTSNSAVTLTLEGVGYFHHVSRAGVVVDLNDVVNSAGVPGPVIQPAGGDDGVYLISLGDIVTLHTSFTAFVADINERLANGSAMKGTHANGKFDDATATLTAWRIGVRLVRTTLQ